MVAVVLFCLGLVGGNPGETDSPAGTPDAAAYQAAASKAGRNAAAHVKLALWCEAHGMTAERLKHLALAVGYDPANTLARGLLGMVGYQGKWDRPEVIGPKIEADPARRALIEEYLDRRAKTARKADAQAKLAAWCDQNGLKEQATAHYSEVIRLDPRRDAAWRHLGYRKQGHHWIKPDEAAAERLEAERQKHADKQWRPRLERIRDGLDSKDPARRKRTDEAIAEVTDPRAVPMIMAVMLRGNDRSRIAGVQMLGQIDGPAASNALATLAIFGPTPELRARALETLVRRDPRDVIGRLIALVKKPFKYEVRQVDGPGTVGRLFVEGEQFNIERIYQNPPIDPRLIPQRIFAPSVPFDPYNAQNLIVMSAVMNGMSVTPAGPAPAVQQQMARAIAANPGNAAAILKKGGSAPAAPSFNAANSLVFDTLAAAAYRDLQIASAYQTIQQATQNMQQRLATDVQIVENTNAGIKDLNGRVLPVLQMVTGEDLGAEPDRWKSWWTDQLGYVYESTTSDTKPTYRDTLTVQTPFNAGMHTACFAAGTLVITISGPRAIESIQVGDRVLAQDPATGQLSFRPVTALHRNKPTATLKIAIDGETVVATGIHRFWKAGKGWTMARELKPGDKLRMVGGTVQVRSIEPDARQPVYNLDVDQDRDFFVGTKGLLVHDFSFVHPVLTPFDREPELATISAVAPSSMLGPGSKSP